MFLNPQDEDSMGNSEGPFFRILGSSLQQASVGCFSPFSQRLLLAALLPGAQGEDRAQIKGSLRALGKEFQVRYHTGISKGSFSPIG